LWLVTSRVAIPSAQISHQRKASNRVVTFVYDCKQISFSSGKTKHRWPSAFLFESPYTLLGMDSRKFLLKVTVSVGGIATK
jgi:hypothetical protein